MSRITRVLTMVLGMVTLLGQTPTEGPILARRYREGERLVYRMEGVNQGQHGTTTYAATSAAQVLKNAAGQWVEFHAWSDFTKQGKAVALSPSAQAFRQVLSLSPGVLPAMPDLSKAPELDGPICDLLTFYADLWIANMAQLRKAGDRAFFPGPGRNSWVSGPHMVVAEDAIDFHLTLKSVDTAAQVAVLVVEHLPPAQPRVKLSAEWMKVPVGARPNNWVQVIRKPEGTWVAEVGQEHFTVELHVDLRDGKLLRATMDNPVEVLQRTCTDAELTQCQAPVRYRIRRKVEVRLMTNGVQGTRG